MRSLSSLIFALLLATGGASAQYLPWITPVMPPQTPPQFTPPTIDPNFARPVPTVQAPQVVQPKVAVVPIPVRARAAGNGGLIAMSLTGALHPGANTSAYVRRLVGFMIDSRRGDIILIGEKSDPLQGSIYFDADMAEALLARLNGNSPYCSLDPVPGDLSGPQGVRVGGVSRTSGFARTMLDADYLMKKMAVGNGGGYGIVSETSRAIDYYRQDCSRLTDAATSGRFWFHPLAPRPGDALASNSGNLVWVKSRVGVQTEATRLQGGQWAASDRRDPPMEDFADDMTRRLPTLAAQQPLFTSLRALYQEVYVASLIVSRADDDGRSLARRWASAVRAPARGEPGPYMGIDLRSEFVCDGRQATLTVTGGVDMDPPALDPTSSGTLDGIEVDIRRAIDASPDDAVWTLDAEIPQSLAEGQ